MQTDMSIILLFPILLVFLLSIVAEVLLGVWTYRDAKARGLNAALWTVVVLLVPSFIGLIIYLVAGRNQSTGLCPNCSAAIQPNVKFCPACGTAVGQAGSTADGSAPPPKPLPRTGKGLLIAFVVCIAMLVVGVVAYALLGLIAYRTNVNGVIVSDISIGSVENNSNKQWNMSFYSLNGEKDCSQLQYDGTQTVHVKASLGSGKMQLVLTQGDVRVAVDLNNPQNVTDINLTEFEPGVIHMALVAENAKDGSVDISWK
jgi:hypothetical protein